MLHSADVLAPIDRWRLMQLAEVATPAGGVLEAPGGETVDAVAELLVARGEALIRGWRALLATLDLAAVPLAGAPLSQLPSGARAETLHRLATSDVTGWVVRAVCAPLQIVRAESPALARSLALPDARSLPIAPEPRRDGARRHDLSQQGGDAELEADVVVIGTGAGGAPLAARLASRGHAVVLLEEGGDFGRADFAGKITERQRSLYRDAGLTFALGNTVIPLPVGRTVGGTTTINSGTCYRTPRDVQRRWALEHGLHALGPGSLDPYFERVEAMLGVAPTPPEVLGDIARIVARGADALGYRHGPLARNAPGCDARGSCCFGCPTDAKRSTNVSYVPSALAHGAELFHHAKAVRLITERGRAVGVEAVATRAVGGRPARLVVRARAVVVAAGALHTPVLLLENRLALGSGEVGRNLTIHPAGFALARFEERVTGWRGVPQGYAIDELGEIGIRFEGAYPPASLLAAALGTIGEEWTRSLESLDHLAMFGFMIRDESRGHVTRGADGRPRVHYHLVRDDVRTVVHAQSALARVFLAAGARDVRPAISGAPLLTCESEVVSFEREALSRVRAHHLGLSAYHPLGTCRMGADASRSVVSAEHEAHEVVGLFVCDASAVPGPLGVNPQLTIMALSERAATFVERRIESSARAHVLASRRRAVVFDETMSGTCERVSDGGRFVVTVHLRVHGARPTVLALGGTLDVDGHLDVHGVVSQAHCVGSLVLRPRARRATLVYDLAFDGPSGERWSMRGEKHAPLYAPPGITRLHTELRRDGALFGEGLLRFDVRDVPSWLATFRVQATPH